MPALGIERNSGLPWAATPRPIEKNGNLESRQPSVDNSTDHRNEAVVSNGNHHNGAISGDLMNGHCNGYPLNNNSYGHSLNGDTCDMSGYKKPDDDKFLPNLSRALESDDDRAPAVRLSPQTPYLTKPCRNGVFSPSSTSEDNSMIVSPCLPPYPKDAKSHKSMRKTPARDPPMSVQQTNTPAPENVESDAVRKRIPVKTKDDTRQTVDGDDIKIDKVVSSADGGLKRNYIDSSSLASEALLFGQGLLSTRPRLSDLTSFQISYSGVSESAGAWGELGHYNILHVTTSDPSQHWFTRYCCYLVHCSRLKVNFPYPAISNQVILEDDRIQTAVDQVVNESIPEDLPVEKRAASCRSLRTMQLARAHRILNDMKAAISTTLIRITGYVLFKVFSRLLKSVVVHKGQLEAIQRASKKGTPLIFVPLHRSHVDYLFVTWVLFNCQIPAPIVAAGENLNMPVFGALLRGTGGFFIKRRLESNKARRDVLYRALLQCYMSHSLHAGYNLEFFIEGGRTRTGKPAMPKGGLLSVILDAYLSGMLDDAMIVPIAINYDKLVDGNFIREQLGQSKVPESFWGAVCAICKVLSTNYGQSRIDFGAPFSLKEFVQLSRIPVAQLAASGTTLLSNFAGAASKGHHRSLSSPVAASHLTVQRPPSISSFAAPASSSDVPCTTDTQLLPAMSNSSLFGTELTDEFRELVKKLGQHIVFDAERCQAMMSSNLVAWVVSFQHRGGATLPLLSAAVHDLKTLLQQRGRDVGFTGDSVDVVKHAVRLLGPSLIRTEVRDGVTVYSPVTCLPNVIELNYYANALLPVFAIDAIIAVSLQSILDCELWPYCDTEPSITVELDKLMKRSLRLCEVFAHEFVLYAPCGNLSTRLLDAVDRLCVIGFLSENKSLSRSLSRRYHGASAHQDDFDSWQVTNEPCDVVGNENNMLYTVVYNVLPTTATLSCLTTFSNMLTPLLDAYCSTVETLQAIIGTKIPEKELVAKTQLLVRERLADESIKFGECIAADPIKNCIKMLESEQVLQSSQQDGDKLINLTTPYNSLEALVVLHDSLAAFRV